MDCLNLRTKNDCILFNQIAAIYRLNDICRMLKNSNNEREVKKVCKSIYDQLISSFDTSESTSLPHCNFLEFQKYCAYQVLKCTLKEIFEHQEEREDEEATVSQMRQINDEELRNYWLKVDYLPLNETKVKLKDLILKQCKIIAKKCYSDTRRFPASDPECWICDINSCYLGLGRLNDPCGNKQDLKHKSTSFVDTSQFNGNCSHLICKPMSEYDSSINDGKI